jgi:hypothetical protein
MRVPHSLPSWSYSNFQKLTHQLGMYRYNWAYQGINKFNKNLWNATNERSGQYDAKLWRCWMHIVIWNQQVLMNTVRGHPSVSLLPLSSPTLHPFICIPPPHLCTIFKDHTYSRRLPGPMVQQLPASLSACTSTASDRLRTHWDRSAWCYSTLHHHMDNHIWEAWY